MLHFTFESDSPKDVNHPWAEFKVFAFLILLSLAGPAHAFISFSTTDIVLIILIFTWPLVLPALLVVLVLQWRRREAHPWRFLVSAVVFLVGTGGWLSVMVPKWIDAVNESRIENAWEEIDAAVAKRHYDKALALIAEHPQGDAHTYLSRQIKGFDGPPDVAFAKVLFSRCVSLLGRGASYSARDLLTEAIKRGRYELVSTWLQSTPCERKDGGSREQDLADEIYWLMPDPPSENDALDLGVRQASIMKALVLRYPALLSKLPSEACLSKVRRSEPCSMVAMAFAKKHLTVVQTLVSLDDQLDKHLPPVVAHVLRNDVLRSREAARHDNESVHYWMPELFASAPIEALRAALEAAPVNENEIMDGNDKKSQFQLLHAIVEAAESRDSDQPTWAYLNLLLDQFPTQLKKLSVDLVDVYGKRRAVEQPQGKALMKRLRAAGMECEALQGMVSWGSAEREQGTEAMAWVGCEPPDDWHPIG